MYIYAASVRCPIFAPTPNRAYRMSANLHRSLIYRLSLSLSLRLSPDYANDHRVKTAGGNTLSPFGDSLSCDEFVYLISFDFLFSLFVHRIIEF